ncbi:MAG: RNA 2',3'-cyclic phosphodiesterase [Clostridia bacterium]|nr:RNA 2',3'-cyclic phosphodiesterase [Clostridia bacterium]
MRLFIALLPDEDFCSTLVRTQDAFRRAGVGGNYAERENLHVTLAFIGEYSDPDAVLDAMKAARPAPFLLSTDGIGSFGGAWWAGVKPTDALTAYVSRLRRALAAAGVPYDKKKFTPHVTLIRRPDRDRIPTVAPPLAACEVAGVSLMRSDRGKNGMIYTEIGYIK